MGSDIEVLAHYYELSSGSLGCTGYLVPVRTRLVSDETRESSGDRAGRTEATTIAVSL